MELLNWDDSKGKPFDYTIQAYHDVISKDFEWSIEADIEPARKCLQKLYYDLHLKTLATLQVHQIGLLSATMDWKRVDAALRKHFQIEKPVTVWLEYPFGKEVKVTIYPLVRIYDRETPDPRSPDYRIVSDFNYYVWQIAIVYADIYKRHCKEIGILMHGFDDLYLECLELHKGNVIRLGIGS